MTEKSLACDEQRLVAMLQEQLDATEIGWLSRHLESCTFCQQRSEELAASPEDWLLAGKALKTTVEDQTLRDFQPASTQAFEARTWDATIAQYLLEPPSHPEMLGRLDRYEIERLVGVGGMGIVFKAYDTELARPVAIKLLAPFLASNGTARKRFGREARAAAAVVHPHVVPIYNVDTNRELPFLVMHYVGGESLQARVDREGSLRVPEILRVGLHIASGLQAAHQQGLVHRDIKPSNILLEDASVERALITDFGLALAADDAQVTRTGAIAGTPRYMSPEQARGETVDEKSDLFSLGSVLYTLCTGRAPFRAQSAVAVLRQIIDDPPQPIRELNSEIPRWLAGIISRLMSKAKEERFASAGELCETLKACLTHIEQPDRFPLPPGLEARPSPQSNSAATEKWHFNGLPLASLTLRALTISLGVATLAFGLLVATRLGFFGNHSNGQPAVVSTPEHYSEANTATESGATAMAGAKAGGSASDFEVLGHGYSRTFNQILFEEQPVIEMGRKNREYLPLWARKYQLAEEIDPQTFRAMNREYARDRNHVYYQINQAERFWLIELAEAQLNTFEVVSGNLAKDERMVWWCGSPHRDIDPQTLQVVRPDFVWKDKASVWYHRQRIDGADPASFEHVGDEYYRDSRRVYWASQPLPSVDPVTFRLLAPGLPYGRDRHSVWERNSRLEQVDPDSCEVLHLNVYKDKTGVFADGLRIETENPEQFRKLADLYGPTCGLFTDNHFGYVHVFPGQLFRVELHASHLHVTLQIVDRNAATPEVKGEASARLTAKGWQDVQAPAGFENQFTILLRVFKQHFEQARRILTQVEDSNRQTDEKDAQLPNQTSSCRVQSARGQSGPIQAESADGRGN